MKFLLSLLVPVLSAAILPALGRAEESKADRVEELTRRLRANHYDFRVEFCVAEKARYAKLGPIGLRELCRKQLGEPSAPTPHYGS